MKFIKNKDGHLEKEIRNVKAQELYISGLSFKKLLLTSICLLLVLDI
ncbi:MAG: hypothetical protein RI935_405 [Candidatus Parcubacteria bacterium]|jgi:hypothetical protein